MDFSNILGGFDLASVLTTKNSSAIKVAEAEFKAEKIGGIYKWFYFTFIHSTKRSEKWNATRIAHKRKLYEEV